MAPARYRAPQDFEDHVPVHVVWELTLACNLRCTHCGSRAGKRRPDELSTAEAIDLVHQLAALGTRELSLIGGEAYLRPDWTEIIAAATEAGISCALQTGARALTEARLRAGAQAGLRGVGVSLDGLAAEHDAIRGFTGSFAQGVLTLRRARDLGLRSSVNTVVNRRTLDDMDALAEVIADAGAKQWQIQLAVPMGNAADHEQDLLQPYELLEVMPRLARLYHDCRRRGVLLLAGNNIGYFGPFEHLWRTGVSDAAHWTGCSAGETVLGIESDGTVKGCPSLATDGYAGGNVRDMSIETMRRRGGGLRPANELWGFCASCYYADVCRAGCTWNSHSLLGRAGNNPFCHHRAETLAQRGRRERVVKVRDAPSDSFATGAFRLVEEDLDGSRPVITEPAAAGVAVRVNGALLGEREEDSAARRSIELELCQGCRRFVRGGERTCPFCDGELSVLAERAEADRARREALMNEILEAIEAATGGVPS